MAHSFESARLSYRQAEESDWPFFLQLYSDERVMQYVSAIESETEIREKFAARTVEWQKSSSEWLSILISDKVALTPLGITGLKFCAEEGCWEIGYLFSPKAWGKGYANESLEALLSYSTSSLLISKFKANVTEGNVASEKLLLSKGFKKDGVQKNVIFINGKWHHDHTYSFYG